MDRREAAKAVGAIVAGAVAGQAHAQVECPTPSRTDVVRRLIEGDGLDEVFSSTHVSHTPWAKVAPNLESVFSGLVLRVEDAVEQGDNVVARWRLTGTLTGPVAGLAATGRPVDVTGINVYRFVGDTIVETWGEMDMAAFAKQAYATVDAVKCQEALMSVA